MTEADRAPAADPQRRASPRTRLYRLEAEGVEPWAVLPLMQLITETLRKHSGDKLTRYAPLECMLTMHFEAFEQSVAPEFEGDWLQAVDRELAIGFAWRCVETSLPNGEVMDEDAMQRQRIERDRAA